MAEAMTADEIKSQFDEYTKEIIATNSAWLTVTVENSQNGGDSFTTLLTVSRDSKGPESVLVKVSWVRRYALRLDDESMLLALTQLYGSLKLPFHPPSCQINWGADRGEFRKWARTDNTCYLLGLVWGTKYAEDTLKESLLQTDANTAQEEFAEVLGKRFKSFATYLGIAQARAEDFNGMDVLNTKYGSARILDTPGSTYVYILSEYLDDRSVYAVPREAYEKDMAKLLKSATTKAAREKAKRDAERKAMEEEQSIKDFLTLLYAAYEEGAWRAFVRKNSPPDITFRRAIKDTLNARFSEARKSHTYKAGLSTDKAHWVLWDDQPIEKYSDIHDLHDGAFALYYDAKAKAQRKEWGFLTVLKTLFKEGPV